MHYVYIIGFIGAARYIWNCSTGNPLWERLLSSFLYGLVWPLAADEAAAKHIIDSTRD